MIKNELNRIAGLCFEALIAEVNATPKPGLVDRNNNGAHADMNLALFHKSANSLQTYFVSVVECGFDGANLPPEQALLALRPIGIEAERTMLDATGGVNTHKGAIFSLGLLAASAGRLMACGMPLDPARVATAAALYVRGICSRELKSMQKANTKGEQAFVMYGQLGARGEAEAGFPAVINVALPNYHNALLLGANDNDALAHSLLCLIAHMLDTNVITRLNMEAGLHAQNEAQKFLDNRYIIGSEKWRKALALMDQDFISRNISPGGCADLVACAWLLFRLSKDF
ncbi:triphosphoribosyl-dephospho-CoA synthase CitG [Eubacteriales bacterium OttesenSCG-928-K08]|nr:triphosphoribosyl-dephospho-CoA synthase CitG [Eubacteriales bacterium OttesenSCG-928-K08]